jgi:actin-like ATPase involved in cell morphogenesis
MSNQTNAKEREDILDSILGDDKVITKANVAKVEIQNKKTETSEGELSKPEFKPGVGVDIGTSNIVVSRQTKDGKFINRFHRNMLYSLDVSDEATDLLNNSSYLYVKVNNKYYVVGEDALTLVNAIGKGEVIRPMKDGILNPSLKESSELLFYIIKAVVGEPIIKNEPLRFCIPANPIDMDLDNVFHKMILMNFFKSMGFDPKAVNEASCVAYDCNPVVKSEEGIVPLSGIACSCGAGMTNIALLYKGMELSTFSITKSGDHVDSQVSKVTGIPKSKIVKRKEKELNLEKYDSSDRVLSALSIYYTEYINRITNLISREFEKRGSEIQGETEIIVAGGTSMPQGFCKVFEDSVNEANFPFKIYRIRQSETPFYSVAQGACIRAQSDYAKINKK